MNINTDMLIPSQAIIDISTLSNNTTYSRCWSCNGLYDPEEINLCTIPPLYSDEKTEYQEICTKCRIRLNAVIIEKH